MNNQISNVPRNARFWSLENGSWVKLTVKPGAVLRWSRFSRDCEGWSFEANAWEHMGGYVQLDWLVRGADCDGLAAPVQRPRYFPVRDKTTKRAAPAR